MPVDRALRARQAQFASRIARLLGLDPSRVGIASASIDEFVGTAPTLRVDIVMRITTEEAARLRYGDDIEVQRTEDGSLTISISGPPEEHRA